MTIGLHGQCPAAECHGQLTATKLHIQGHKVVKNLSRVVMQPNLDRELNRKPLDSKSDAQPVEPLLHHLDSRASPTRHAITGRRKSAEINERSHRPAGQSDRGAVELQKLMKDSRTPRPLCGGLYAVTDATVPVFYGDCAEVRTSQTFRSAIGS